MNAHVSKGRDPAQLETLQKSEQGCWGPSDGLALLRSASGISLQMDAPAMLVRKCRFYRLLTSGFPKPSKAWDRNKGAPVPLVFLRRSGFAGYEQEDNHEVRDAQDKREGAANKRD
jgi:hypothetical protein